MIPDPLLDGDTRAQILCLLHRAHIILPDVILADGTASPDQVARIPRGVSVALAALPHRELGVASWRWSCAALVGTRLPALIPYMSDRAAKAIGSGASMRHIMQPRSADDIRRWLFDISGVRYAPAAFWKVAGWEIGWLAEWLERMRAGGPMAHLSIAERQAAAAVRAAWCVHRHDRNASASLIQTGALIAVRATLDMVQIFERLVATAKQTPTPTDYRRNARDAYAAIRQRLRSCLGALEDAARPTTRDDARRKKIASVLGHARDIVETIALFTVVDEEIGPRLIRIAETLPIRGRPEAPTLSGFAAELEAIAMRVERIATDPGFAVLPSQWAGLLTGDLSRLLIPYPQARRDRLAEVRTDLIVKLIVTRRLDRLFEALPWMAAPSGAFPLTFGGPLGAVAAVFEVARAHEIALELKRRTFDSIGGPRLDARRGQREISDPTALRHALRNRTRVGLMLASSALSHHMVQAWLTGSRFDPAHPLPTLARGHLDHDFVRAMDDPAIIASVATIELAKPIYTQTGYHRDLAVYMGLTQSDILSAVLIEAFPGEARDPGVGLFIRLADARRSNLKIDSTPASVPPAGIANREMLRSMLKSLDTPTDGRDDAWRIFKSVRPAPRDHELAYFDDRHGGHVGCRSKDGGAVRKRAARLLKDRARAIQPLKRRIDQARIWPREKGKAVSDDRPLVSVLRGLGPLPGLTPVAQTFAPCLWFRPAIDAERHAWIANGAQMSAPLAQTDAEHAGAIALQVQAVVAAMPRLFGMPVAPAVRQQILVPLWTGLAGITGDQAHVRQNGKKRWTSVAGEKRTAAKGGNRQHPRTS
jgi:hypothetical protein